MQEKSGNERCKQIFMKQLEDAKKRAAGLGDDGVIAGFAAARQPKLQEGERHHYRNEAIEAYRRHKRQQSGGSRGSATMASLTTLVRQQSSRSEDMYNIR